MGVIDSDAHVIETDATWNYLDETGSKYRPAVLSQRLDSGEQADYWLIDGSLHRIRRPAQAVVGPLDQGDHVSTPDDARLLSDPMARVRHMDVLGTDIQVLYPTLFILPVTTRPEVERALCRSYNRWLADIWSQANGRLRWAVQPPLLSMEVALEELRYGREHGACGVFMRGLEVGNRMLSDPYFFPLYEEAARLDLPICVHTGNSSSELMGIYDNECGFSRFKLVGIGAFHHIVFNQIPDRFPGLRFAFVELSSQWLPYVIRDLNRRFERLGKPIKENVLRDNRIWVTCQTNDDIAGIVEFVGEDNLIIGTDYGHADTSTEIFALQSFRRSGTVSAVVADKILDANPRALYGL